mmetsp:Transcript_6724/g.17178  ORF Transcript_6724/g.17178 Transcript_6724/m.17178 type:complete len:293 (-) Transcript_6724:466-1344(-)|eukprot:CAMPEP_0202037286 /NCGR_PEP_ID=MMETSP0962-20130828/2077_1 /ASSEMBLY_ACC=CAM_ASM_000488 /TAXON_ID=4773 /ORGANISM="Schizochytrium aggregatum, Strain ATCC28209" /LENGTH=292 /DNA_ID=CAMNT_0048601395 /DNA_START=108 /DNA_END=986 /DNA_ORIENTATION=-
MEDDGEELPQSQASLAEQEDEAEREAEALRCRLAQWSKLKSGLRKLEADASNSKREVEQALEAFAREEGSRILQASRDFADRLDSTADCDVVRSRESDHAARQEKLLATYLNGLRLLITCENRLAATSKVVRACDDMGTDSELPDVESLLSDQLRKVPPPDQVSEVALKKHPAYAFVAEHRSDGQDDDDDVDVRAVSSGPDIPVRCAVTQGELVDPVQSKKCKHIFSKQGIFSLFKDGQKKKCPTAGCGQTLRKSDFESSDKLKRDVEAAIRKHKRELERQSQSVAATQFID